VYLADERNGPHLFQFELLGLDDVEPWGSEKTLSMHWFGLTDGWYWMQAGDQQLFRRNATNDGRPFVGYHVVRLWEDLLEIVPAMLAPVPADIAEGLLPEARPLQWQHRACELLSKVTGQEAQREEELATGWISSRRLDSFHFTHSPRIWFWTAEGVSHLAWDNREHEIDGRPVWSSGVGHISMPQTQLIAQVRSFHDRLMAAMSARVDVIVAGGWRRPEVQIDQLHVVADQADRQTWFEQALSAAARRATENWEAVRAMIHRVDEETRHG